MSRMSDLVETYSGHRLHERPVRFWRDGAWRTVTRVLDRWQEPEALHFKVRTAEGEEFHLQYHRTRDSWEVRPLCNKPL